MYIEAVDMENELVVEVTLDNSRVYKAFVNDVLSNGLEVSFEKNWKPKSHIDFENVRFPVDDVKKDFELNQLVELCQHDYDHKVDFWIKAILSEFDLMDDKYTVNLIENNDPFTVLNVKRKQIRHFNNSPTIGPSTLTKIELNVPEKLWTVARDPNVHAPFRIQVDAAVCNFIPDKHILRVISTRGEITRRRVNLLINLHLHHLEDVLKDADDSTDGNYCVEFDVSEALIGLSLGRKYSNVNRARRVPGIIDVKFIENLRRFKIIGKNTDAVEKARNMLEYVECSVSIPLNVAEKMLEKNDKILEEIVEQSGCAGVESGEDDSSYENSEYPIKFIGNPFNVDNAKTLLGYQVKLAEMKSETSKQPILPMPAANVIRRVPIKSDLKGLAIGKNYENVKKAENIPGIIKIEVPNESSMFIIHATNEEAAKEATKILEFDEEVLEVFESSLGRIIGKRGMTIKKIESSCEGVRINIPKREEASNSSSDGKVLVNIVGPAHNVPKAFEMVRAVLEKRFIG